MITRALPYAYCWCGHLVDGHSPAIESGKNSKTPMICQGLQPPNESEQCRCDKFVPVEVAIFRMADRIQQLVNFFVSAMAKPDENRIVPPGALH